MLCKTAMIKRSVKESERYIVKDGMIFLNLRGWKKDVLNKNKKNKKS